MNGGRAGAGKGLGREQCVFASCRCLMKKAAGRAAAVVRSASARPLPLSDRGRRRAGARCAATFLALCLFLAALPAAAFLPGRALTAEAAAELRSAGLAGVPAPRAFRLPELEAGRAHEFNLLVLLVEFADVRAGAGRQSPADVHRLLFGDGGNTPTLADYYRSNSGGRFELRGQVTRWVRVDSTMAYYAGDAGGLSTAAYPRNARRLVEEALEKVAGTIDAAQFDNNGDGLVDGVLVIHAGQGVDESVPLGTGDNRRRILAHQFRTTREVPLGGAAAFDYAIADEQLRLGVVAHEFGHLLGLVDLYDTAPFNGSNGPFGVGDWSLMGTGALLNGGRNPCNLDAWSRHELGFTHVLRLDATDGGVPVTLTRAADTVLRAWGAGGESEYFLLEPRPRTGFDAWLPGEGVVIYHVDESVPANSAGRYKVRVIQADGRNDLGRIGGNRGDQSDPYPSLFPRNEEFSPTSDPSSRSNSGTDSRVRIENIRPGGGGWTMDVTVGAVARPVITGIAVRETEGNLDGYFTAGERGAIDVTVRNLGRTLSSDNLALVLSPKSNFVTMERGVLPIGPIGKDEERNFTGAFLFRVEDASPPPAAWFNSIFAFSECPLCPTIVAEDSLLVSLGAEEGLSADFSAPAAGWSTESLSAFTFTAWTLTDSRFRSAPSSFFIGSATQAPYEFRLDAVLTSPPFRIPSGGQLVFHHALEAESLSTGRAWDGGLIEIALDGGGWTDLVPEGGYPFRVEQGGGNVLFGRGVYSGNTRGFRREAIDLARWAGRSARIRFRFASDAFSAPVAEQKQGGWAIDDVAVETAPSRVTIEATVPEGDRVQLSLVIDGERNGLTLEVLRRTDAPDSRAVPLRVFTGGSAVFQLADEPPPGRYVYEARLVTEDGAGLTFRSQVVTVIGAGAAPRLERPYPAPYDPSGPPLTIEYVLPRGAEGRAYELDIVDVQGRLVARLAGGTAVPGSFRTRWIGASSSGGLRGGVYWARLKIEGYGDRSRRIVVTP